MWTIINEDTWWDFKLFFSLGFRYSSILSEAHSLLEKSKWRRGVKRDGETGDKRSGESKLRWETDSRLDPPEFFEQRVSNCYFSNSWHLDQFVCHLRKSEGWEANHLKGEVTPFLGLWAHFQDKSKHSPMGRQANSYSRVPGKLGSQGKVHQRHHWLTTALNSS